MEHVIKIKDKKVYQSLVAFLKALGLDIHGNEIPVAKHAKVTYPLRGTLLKYEKPFEPSVTPDQWESNHDSH